MPLRIGNHQYFDTQIEVWPVRTLLDGLCYKLFFGKSLTYQLTDPDSIAIIVTNNYEIDNIEGNNFKVT